MNTILGNHSEHQLLSRYDPLERILVADDFDDGMRGWQTLFPDYDGITDYPGKHPNIDPLDKVVAASREDGRLRFDLQSPAGRRGLPMLSTLTSWDIGTYGSWDGCYALKIPTIARAGSKGVALKRLACPWWKKFRVETYFTYKAEPCDFQLGEQDVRSVFLTFDVMDPHHIKSAGEQPVRWWPGVRYHNAQDGRLINRWQGDFSGSVGVMDGPWEYLDDGAQELGFNRSPTKYQWHYLRFTFDLAKREYADLHCYGQEFDVAGRRHVQDPPLTGWRASAEKCPGLIAVVFGIETNSPKRCFLYLDSVVVSASDK